MDDLSAAGHPKQIIRMTVRFQNRSSEHNGGASKLSASASDFLVYLHHFLVFRLVIRCAERTRLVRCC
jgi:hypothetical protein